MVLSAVDAVTATAAAATITITTITAMTTTTITSATTTTTTTTTRLYFTKDKDLFIGPKEFVVGYSKAPEQPQSSARPICHSHAMTRTGREPTTIRTTYCYYYYYYYYYCCCCFYFY